MTAVLTDSFTDTDGDGKAKPGDEITYTATIVNNGTTDATNVVYTDQRDSKTTLVPGSVHVQTDNLHVLRCAFATANAGRGECSLPTGEYSQTNTGNYSILGGQSSWLKLTGVNPLYDAGTQTFQFDATLQNLLGQALGTIDDVTVESSGVRLFLNAARVTSDSGSINFANPDGTEEFTAPDQPYAQYDEILSPNEVSPSKTLQFNVPNTVDTFTLDFLVSTRIAAKLVINEVMVNPAGPASEQTLEWFEVYNAGRFPVYMQGFKVGDSAASGDRPTHVIASPLTIEPGTYLVFGGSANTTTNGGVPVDYAYGAALNLVNSVDAVRILSPHHIDPSVNDPTGNVIEIDRVRYASAGISAQEGVSRELKNPALDNFIMDDSNWADASVTSVYGAGGRGTPKAQNSSYTPFWAGNEPNPSIPLDSGFDSVSGTMGKNNSSIASQSAPLAGETVWAGVNTILPGGSAVVTYKVTIANPLSAGTTEISAQGTVAGDGFSVTTDDPAATGGDDSTVTPLAFAPTAAPVSISGRVVTSTGRGIRNVQITLTDASGTKRTSQTTAFGYYRFNDISAGETVTLSVKARRFRFSRSTIVRTTNESIANADFVSEQ